MKPLDFKSFQRLKGMTYNQANVWVVSLYKQAYADGLDAKECEARYTPEEMVEILLEYVTQDTANEIIERLLQ